MKMPAKFRAYCPHCRSHEIQEVEKVKKGRTSHLHWIDRQKARRGKVGNMGKFSKVPGGDKPTKRVESRAAAQNGAKVKLHATWRAGQFAIV